MAVIIGGAGLGQFDVHGQGSVGSASGLSINAFTGNVVAGGADQRLISQGLDLSLARTYNSQGASGEAWRFSFERSVLAAGDVLERVTGDGHRSVFRLQADGSYLSTAGSGAHDVLTRDGDNWVYTEGSTGLREVYRVGDGQLQYTEDSDGNRVTYGYENGVLTSLDSAGGETLRVVYDDAGRVSRLDTHVVGADGDLTHSHSKVYYGYDDAGRLSSVTVDLSPADKTIEDGHVFTTSYTYQDPASSLLKTISQSNGSVVTLAYQTVDGQSRLSNINDNGQVTTFAWDNARANGHQLAVTDASGAMRYYQHDAQGRLTSVLSPAVAYADSPGAEAAVVQGSITYTYDDADNLNTVTDASGSVVRNDYDDNGNLTEVSRDGVLTLSHAYDSNNQRIRSTRYAADGSVEGISHAVYDGRLLRFTVSATGSVTEYTYNSVGERASTRVHTGAVFDNGAVVDLSALTGWASTQNKQQSVLTDHTYARGEVATQTTYTRLDAAGQGIVVSDITVSASAAASGRGVTVGHTPVVSDLGTGITLTVLNAQHEVVSSETIDTQNASNGGTLLANALDALVMPAEGGKVVVTGSDGWANNISGRAANALKALGLDHPLFTGTAEERRASETLLVAVSEVKDGQWSLMDQRVQAASDTLTLSVTGTEHVHMTYDAFGNLLGTQRLSGNLATGEVRVLSQTSQMVDGLNRVISTTDAAGNTVSTQYLDASRQVLVTQESGLVTERTFSVRGDLLTESQQATGETTRTRGFVYDARGQLVATTYPNGSVSVQQYDVAGRLWVSVSATGQVTEYRRNSEGRVIQEIRYDSALDMTGWLSDVDGPSALTVTAEDILSQVSEKTTHRSITTEYDVRGRQYRVIDGEGRVVEHHYDHQDRQVGILSYTEGDKVNAVSVTQTYDAAGRLDSQTDAEGFITRHVYDEAGRLIETSGLVDRVQTFYDAKGRQQYTVNAQGFVTETRYLDAGREVATYRYEKPVTHRDGGITSILNKAGDAQLLSRVRHDDAGRLVSSINQHGIETRYHYDDVTGLLRQQTSAANTDDSRSVYHTYTGFNELKGQVSLAGKQEWQSLSLTDLVTQQGSQTTYNTMGWTDTATHPATGTTQYAYDNAGRLLSTTDAAGRTTSRTYNAFGDTETRTAGGELKEAFTYDNAGRLARTVDGEGITTAYHYNDQGHVSHTVRQHVSDAYQAFNTTGGGARGDLIARYVTQYGYDARGNVIAQSVAKDTREGSSLTGGDTLTDIAPSAKLKYVSQWARKYDHAGRVISSIDGAGRETQTLYLSQGRYQETRLSGALQERIELDALGRTLTHKNGKGLFTLYTYDDQRSTISMLTPGGVRTVTEKNAHGEIAIVTDGEGNERRFHYDHRGQVTRTEFNAAGSDTLETLTTNSYDTHTGQLAFTIDSEGAKTEYTYTDNGLQWKVIQHVDDITLTTEYRYDSQHRRVWTNSEGRVTTVRYDSQNRQVHTELGGIATTYQYDANGQVLRSVDGKVIDSTETAPAWVLEERVTEYGYDAQGNMTHKVVKSGADWDQTQSVRTTEYRYNDAGQVTEKITGNGAVTRYTYDNQGRVVHEVNALNYVTEYKYDVNGRVIQTTRYANAITLPRKMTVFLTGEAVKGIADSAKDRVTKTQYDKDGRITYEIDGAGYATGYTYNANGQVLTTTQYHTPTTEAGWNQTSTANRTTHSLYDGKGQLRFTVSPNGQVSERRYDGEGRVTQTLRYGETVNITAALTDTATLSEHLKTQLANETVRSEMTVYDVLGRKRFTLDGDGYLVEYQYNRHSEVATKKEYVNNSAIKNAIISVRNGDSVLSDYGVFQQALDTLGGIEDAAEYLQDRLNEVNEQQARIDSLNAEISALEQEIAATDADNHTLGIDINDAANRIDSLYLEVREEAAYQESLKEDILALRQEITDKENDLRTQYAEELTAAQSAADAASAAYEAALSNKAVTEAAVQALVGESNITELLPDMTDDFASQTGMIALSTQSDSAAQAALSLLNTAESQLVTAINAISFEGVTDEAELVSLNTQLTNLQAAIARVFQTEQAVRNDMAARYTVAYTKANQTQTQTTLADVQARLAHMEAQIAEHAFTALGEPTDVKKTPLSVSHEIADARTDAELQAAIEQAQADYEATITLAQEKKSSLNGFMTAMSWSITQQFTAATDNFSPSLTVPYQYNSVPYLDSTHALFDWELVNRSYFNISGYSDHFEQALDDALSPGGLTSLQSQQTTLQYHLGFIRNISETTSSVAGILTVQETLTESLSQLNTLLSDPSAWFLTLEEATALWQGREQELNAPSPERAHEAAVSNAVSDASIYSSDVTTALSYMGMLTDRLTTYHNALLDRDEAKQTLETLKNTLSTRQSESVTTALREELRAVSIELQQTTADIAVQQDLLKIDSDNSEALAQLAQLEAKETALLTTQSTLMAELDATDSVQDVVTSIAINSLDDAVRVKVDAEQDILANKAKIATLKGEVATLSEKIKDQLGNLAERRSAYETQLEAVQEADTALKNTQSTLATQQQNLASHVQNVGTAEAAVAQLSANKQSALEDQSTAQQIIQLETQKLDSANELLSIHEPVLTQQGVLDEEANANELSQAITDLDTAKTQEGNARTALRNKIGGTFYDEAMKALRLKPDVEKTYDGKLIKDVVFPTGYSGGIKYESGYYNKTSALMRPHFQWIDSAPSSFDTLINKLRNIANGSSAYDVIELNNQAIQIRDVLNAIRGTLVESNPYFPDESIEYAFALDQVGDYRLLHEINRLYSQGVEVTSSIRRKAELAIDKLNEITSILSGLDEAIKNGSELSDKVAQLTEVDEAYDKVTEANAAKEAADTAIGLAKTTLSDARRALVLVDEDIFDAEVALTAARSARQAGEAAVTDTRASLAQAEVDKANAEILLLQARVQLNVAADNYNEAQSALLLATDSLDSAYDNLGVALDLHRQADMYIRQAEVSKDEAKATLAEAQELVSLAVFSAHRKANADIASHDTSYEYDGRGLLKTEFSALVSFGEHTEVGVQQFIGRLATEHTYDSLGNVRATTTAANTNHAATTEFEYDVQSNQTRSIGLGGGSVIYNNQNLAAVNINALEHRRDRVYDDEGRLRYEVDELGFVTEHRYDGLNQKAAQRRYANAHTVGRPEGEPLTLAELEAFVSGEDAGDFRVLNYRYTARGELETTTTSSTVDSQIRTNGVHHNAFGDKTSTFTTYVDGQGESVSVTNQHHLYNATGQLMASRDAEAYVTVYAYNGFGELSSQREIKARYVDNSDNPLAWDWESVKAWAGTQQGAARERRTDFAYDARGHRQQVTQLDVEYAQHGGTTVEQVRGDLITTTYHDHAGRQFMTVQEAAPSDPASHVIAENRTLQSYDALGRLVSSWSKRKDYVVSGLQLSLEGVIPDRLQKHQLTSYRYDTQGNLIATESDGRTTYQYYDAEGKLTRRVDAEGNATHVEMDDMNRTKAEWRNVSAPGYQYQQRTEYNYDATGRQTGTTVVVNGGDNIREEARYNAFGEVEVKTHNGVVQEAYAYDGLGRVDTKTMYGSQHNVITTYQYNWLDKVTVETLGGNRTTTRAYDHKGNLTEEKGPHFDGKQSETTQTFDRWGNVLKQTMNGNTYDFVYNHANQVILQTSPLEDETIVDGTGQVDNDARPQTRMFYDRHGNRIAMQDANGHWQWSGYDLTGQKLWDKNGQGGITRYYHNIHGEMVGRINADGQGEVYRYNNNGQLLTRSKIDNTQEVLVLYEGAQVYYHFLDNGSGGYLEVYAQYAYDQAGQRYHEQWFGGSGYEIYTQFDAAGRVLETKGAGQHKRYTYDSFGNKEAEIWLDGGAEQARKTSAYDAFGKLSTETLYDGSVVTHHYDKYGQLDNQLDKKTGAINIDYDYWENGLLKSQTAGTKTESYQYNADGKETRRALSDGATALVTHTEWDNLGRIERIRNEAVSAFGQSLEASTVTYRYDAVGNRRKITTMGEQSSTRWYHYDKDNRMVGSHTRVNDVDVNSIGNHAGDRKITYTATGQKKEETRWENKTRDGHTALVETFDVFDYDSNGHLKWVESAEVVQGQSYVVRQMSMENHKTGHADLQRDTVYTYAYVNGQVSGNATESKTTVIDFAYQDGRLSWQDVKESGDPTTTTHFHYHFNGQLREQRNVIFGEDRGVDTYTYTYRAKDLQKETITAESTRRGSGSGFKAGTTTYNYNNAGQLTGITSTRDDSERKHLTDFNGQIALQLDAEDNTLLANLTTSGNPLATITKGKVDADLLDDSGSSAGQQPGTYTVGANDTLQRISQMVYGDSRYWYLIADANGLSPTEPLTEGKLLVIPNQHTQTFNGAESFKPYNESEVLGNVNPDPIALPPPKKSCNPIAMIVMAVVAVVVAIYAPYAAGAIVNGIGLGGTVVGAVATNVISGALISAATQLTGMALGVQEDFSWKQLALSAVTNGLTGGGGTPATLPQALAASAVNYGVNYAGSKALGMDVSFSWKNLAASAASSLARFGLNQGGGLKALGVTDAFVGNSITGFAGSATSSVLRGESFRGNAGALAVDAFGNVLGNEIVRSINTTNVSNTVTAKVEEKPRVAPASSKPTTPTVIVTPLPKPVDITEGEIDLIEQERQRKFEEREVKLKQFFDKIQEGQKQTSKSEFNFMEASKKRRQEIELVKAQAMGVKESNPLQSTLSASRAFKDISSEYSKITVNSVDNVEVYDVYGKKWNEYNRGQSTKIEFGKWTSNDFSETTTSLKAYSSVSFGDEEFFRHYTERTVSVETSQLVSGSSPIGEFTKTLGFAGEISEATGDTTDNFLEYGNTPKAFIATGLDYFQQFVSGVTSTSAGGIVGVTTGTLAAATGWGAPFAPALAVSSGTYTAYKLDQEIDMIWDYHKPKLVDIISVGYEVGGDAIDDVRKYFD